MIETYILCNNEERLIPYLLRHYLRFSKVIILESNSTDKTVELASKLGADVWKYDVPDEIDDQWFLKLKNNCWKESKADWVIIADADEFVYSPNIELSLKRSPFPIIQPRFYNMYSDKFPTTQGQIYEEVNKGVEQISPKAKMNIFKPSIKDINYLPGCHEAFPSYRVNSETDIKTLHMRNLGLDFVIERNLRARERASAINKQNGWGLHVEWPKEEWIKRFNEGTAEAKNIILND